VSVADASELRITRRRWRRLIADLAHRGGGHRESGAFLLARKDRRPRTIVDWIPFDELDPHCLNGAIEIRGEAFSTLWSICARDRLRVVADVHTHPGRSVAQSGIDRANPMVARRGHVALILPAYAQDRPALSAVGFHVYRGDRTWDSRSGESLLRLTWWER
jgi:proteasome lid subunit RPN8/RPN11